MKAVRRQRSGGRRLGDLRRQEATVKRQDAPCILSPVSCLLRSIRPSDLNVSLAVVRKHANQPRVATHFAVLNEIPLHVGLEVELDLFSAVRTRDEE